MAARRDQVGGEDFRRGLRDLVGDLRKGGDAVREFGGQARQAGTALGVSLGRGAAGLLPGAFGGIIQGTLAGGAVGGALAGLQAAGSFVQRTNEAKAQAELAAPLFSGTQRVRAEGRDAASIASLEASAALKDQLNALRKLAPEGPAGELVEKLFPVLRFGRDDGSADRDRIRSIREQNLRLFGPIDRATDTVSAFVGDVAFAGGSFTGPAIDSLLRRTMDAERRRFDAEENTRNRANQIQGLSVGQAGQNGGK